jgi:glycosyltransferase involved in cell wall biosynthesis
MANATITEPEKPRAAVKEAGSSGTFHRGKLVCAVVSAVFPPEYTFSGRVCEQVAHALAAEGHEVKVFAPFPNRPGGKMFPGFKRALSRKENHQAGYQIVRSFSTLAPNSRMLPRLMENLSFGIGSALQLLITPRPDVIYSNSWPIFASALLAAVARLRNIPYVMTIQDVYPESLQSQSRTKANSAIFRIMRRIDKWVANRAAGVIVICEGFERLYLEDRGVDPAKLHLVYNWGEPVQERSSKELSEFRERHGIPRDAFLAVYGGNIGPASGTIGLVDTFAKLGDTRAYLLIAGAGSELGACRQRASQLGCERVKFHSPWTNEETELVLGAADIVLLPTKGQQALVSVPSKLITYMFMGKPVLAQVNSDSETASIVTKANAGWVLPPDQPELLCARIRELAGSDGKDLAALGENGRRFAAEYLSREKNLPKLVGLIREIAYACHKQPRI